MLIKQYCHNFINFNCKVEHGPVGQKQDHSLKSSGMHVSSFEDKTATRYRNVAHQTPSDVAMTTAALRKAQH
jgi:hypothetical protein